MESVILSEDMYYNYHYCYVQLKLPFAKIQYDINILQCYLDDAIAGTCCKPFIARLNCDTSYPAKVTADDLSQTTTGITINFI